MSEQKFLIGIDKEDNFIYIEDFNWDCDWYWGGGYVELGILQTLEELEQQAQDEDVEDIWKEIVCNGNYTQSLEDFEEEYKESFEERIDEIDREDNNIIVWHTHTHFDSLLLNKEFKDLFKITNFNEDTWRDLNNLFRNFYHLNRTAEYFYHKDTRIYNKINKTVETEIISEIRKILNEKQFKLSELIEKFKSEKHE